MHHVKNLFHIPGINAKEVLINHRQYLQTIIWHQSKRFSQLKK